MGVLPEYIFEDDWEFSVRVEYSYLASNHVDGPICCMKCDGRRFVSRTAILQHIRKHQSHSYCETHDREFMNHNNLMAHLNSKSHVVASYKCPNCSRAFTSLANVAAHLESAASCLPNGRHDVKRLIQKLDRDHLVTKKAIELPGYAPPSYEANYSSWNGSNFECFLCGNEYRRLSSLNSHLNSPSHDQPFYRCPGPGCGREFRVLQGLMGHIENGSCGVSRFRQTQDVMKSISNGMGNLRLLS